VQFDHARPTPDDPALRYSLAEFAELIFAVFAAAGVTSIAEIGAEGGAFTAQLARWAEDHDGSLLSIEPAPSDLVRELDAASPATTLSTDSSLDTLPGLPAFDAYLIDGDHNYYTVSHELELIAAAATEASSYPLLIVDDVGWPSGRRDLYYRPDSLPPEGVLPYDYGGIVPWSRDTGIRGFRGEGHFAFARHEGGARNGVLTALEDFLAGSPGWEAISLPCLFGVAFVFPPAAPWAGAVRAVLAPFSDHPLLARLEANRLFLYLRVIDAQDEEAKRRRLEADRAAGLESQLDEARVELAVAREAVRQVEAERDAAVAAAGSPPPVPPPTRRSPGVRALGRALRR
jgi:Methyltransferase domain